MSIVADDILLEYENGYVDVDVNLITNKKIEIDNSTCKVDTIYIQKFGYEKPHLEGYAHNGDVYSHEPISGYEIENLDVSMFVDENGIINNFVEFIKYLDSKNIL